MKQVLQYIITSLVEKPESISIDEQEADGIVNFTISVAKEDMGRIIGKEGKVIRAVRNVMKIPAIKQGKRINISLAETA